MRKHTRAGVSAQLRAAPPVFSAHLPRRLFPAVVQSPHAGSWLSVTQIAHAITAHVRGERVGAHFRAARPPIGPARAAHSAAAPPAMLGWDRISTGHALEQRTMSG